MQTHDAQEEEPQTPMWLPALGVALFLVAGIWWATRAVPQPAPPPAAPSASAPVAVSVTPPVTPPPPSQPPPGPPPRNAPQLGRVRGGH
jgi:hypothetical protein